MQIHADQTYIARNQGTAITPRDITVIVVWVDGDTVYYCHQGKGLVQQTPLKRFIEIVGE